MLLIECPICNRRELRGIGSIALLENTRSGIIATVSCSQGHVHQMATGIKARPIDETETATATANVPAGLSKAS